MSAVPRTMAGLLPEAAARFGARPAIRHRAGGAWRDVSFAELARIADELAHGLIDLGIGPGDRVALLAQTRPEWTYADLAITAAGATVVPIYPTSSAQECAWIVEHADVAAVVCEDAAQAAKLDAVRGRLRAVAAIEPAPGAVALARLRRPGDPARLAARRDAVGPDDPYTIIYTSGTTGAPKGCVLTHGNYRAGVDMVTGRDVLDGERDLVYLFLPLAHSFALLIQMAALDAGTPTAYWTGDPGRILDDLRDCRPTFLPSVPRVFEKAYGALTAGLDPATLARACAVGGEVQRRRVAGEPVPAALAAEHAELDAAVFARVRAAFGGRLRQASSGAAPIAHEILAFFWACGIPVMEGYGMTETATAVTVSTPEHHRFGTVGRAVPGVELRIAADGEILLRGPNVFGGYLHDPEATAAALDGGWLRTGDLGAVDADGYLTITGRKKDIIITAGGKNLTPANLENDLRRSPYVSHAVMHGDRRPFPTMLVTLDEPAIVAWARERGIADVSLPALAEHPDVVALIQAELDAVNARYAQVAQVKRFFILDRDLSPEAGELTASLKVRRQVVNERYAQRFDALYAASPSAPPRPG